MPVRIAQQRARRLSRIQRPIGRRKTRALIGRTLRVLVEGTSAESEFVLVGRHAGQAPEVDGVVYLSGEPAPIGSMVTVQVTQAVDYDLAGEVLHVAHPGSPAPHSAAPNPARASQPLLFKQTDGRLALRTLG